jgi:hypothetical protein
VKKYVDFTHVTKRAWEQNAETIENVINSLEAEGYKVISVSFSTSGMVACIYYRKTIWKAIKNSFNIPYWE